MTADVNTSLQDKVAIVTGANGGMGLAICKALVGVGVKVVASDVQPNASIQLSDSTYLRTNVADETEVKALIDLALKQHGSLDCAVNAAAIEFETQRLADCDAQDFDNIINVNLRGVFLSMKYELKAMVASGGGAIVNLASTNSFQAQPIQPAYTASKHAVVGLTRQAAVDYAQDNIRVNAVAPGNIETPMLREAIKRRGIDHDAVAKRMPFRRFGKPEEIAAAVLWLCSSASSFTTGHVLPVESGMLLR